MRAGQLRKRIRLQQRSSAQDSSGEQVHVWSDVATVWAEISPVTGRELQAAGAVQQEASHTVTMRYRAGLDASMRILYGTRIFNIVAPPIDEDERHRQFTVLCSERLNEG